MKMRPFATEEANRLIGEGKSAWESHLSCSGLYEKSLLGEALPPMANSFLSTVSNPSAFYRRARSTGADASVTPAAIRAY